MIKQLKAVAAAGAVALAFAAAAPASAQSFLPSSSSEVGYFRWTPEMMHMIDRNKDGVVSRQEFLSYMGAQFDIMDAKKRGSLSRSEFMDARMMGLTFLPSMIGNAPTN